MRSAYGAVVAAARTVIEIRRHQSLDVRRQRLEVRIPNNYWRSKYESVPLLIEASLRISAQQNRQFGLSMSKVVGVAITLCIYAGASWYWIWALENQPWVLISGASHYPSVGRSPPNPFSAGLKFHPRLRVGTVRIGVSYCAA